MESYFWVIVGEPTSQTAQSQNSQLATKWQQQWQTLDLP